MGRLILIVIANVLSTPGSAGALFPPNAPQAERQAALEKFFEPRFDQELQFDRLKVLNFKRGDSFETLSGSITVRPPKGSCFVIEVNPDYPDQKFCKQGELRFNFRDLDPVGRLSAMVKVDGDFGTEVSWVSSYRLALTIAWDAPADSAPDQWLIVGCEAYHDELGRHLRAEILGERPWIFHFPAKDKLLPQPPPVPNLKIIAGTKFTGVMDAAARRKVENEAREKEAKGESAGVVIAAQRGGPEERHKWHMPIRDSYEMSADNFQPRGRVPQGGNGVCWYRYKGSADDPDVGRIECHDADKFQFMYAPLVCLKGV